ncbi:M66 family metalloprotease [Budvicia diplopodorum]|uniref:M66 family metalloprotease n=1 Tax=Budvicia diplopodorum TaxID=1119056 RepID=UPI0014789718|nr:M66 family metalloprotease [Budvicia diplopodorum]
MHIPKKIALNGAVVPTTEKLVFNTNENSNDLQGTLAASIKFAQSQIFPAIPKPGDSQPYLAAGRKILLMVKPLNAVNTLHVTVLNRDGVPLGSRLLNSPDLLPKTAYYIDGIPDSGVDFTPQPGPTYTINNNSGVNKLSDPQGTFLLEKLQQNAVVDIQTADGCWVDDIYLPSSSTVEGKIVRVQSTAVYASTILYSNRGISISRGLTYQFKFVSGQWFCDAELGNQGLIYADNIWSVEIPAQWVKPGISLRFDSDSLSGQLNNLRVGASTELLINTIDIGMLTPPRGAYAFAKDPHAHEEYFQTIPTTRMVVSNYQSLYLPEVMLPNGTLLTDFDPSVGDWHSGTMRQRIGKELISLGINHANYGINCSAGEGEWSPYTVAQLTAHNSCGKYSNGIVVHGGSGGGGIVTLDSSIGNEFSHEVGHNYGLGHYPNGFNGSVHRAANEINSTWGWDMSRGKFIPNFWPMISDKETCYQGTCQPPFYGHTFGFDPMAGGEPMSQLIRFTLHTPYTAAIIQKFMESKAVFAADSKTGFRKWEPDTQQMEPYDHRVDATVPTVVSNGNLSEEAISAMFDKNQMVKVAMQDGNWAPSIYVPPASSVNDQCIITIDHEATLNSQLYINGQTILVSRGFNTSYISNGLSWNECILLDMSMTRYKAPNNDLSESTLISLLAKYQVLNMVMWDGDWAPSIHIPPASQANDRRVITIDHNATYNTQLYVNGLSIQISQGMKKYYISDGDLWIERRQLIDMSVERYPKAFGVPVTTLVGYYDPLGELQSYLYPALHGGYGFLYADDSGTLTEADYQLWVESDNEIQRFKLNNSRIQSNVMNKFHINIAESELPRTVALVHNGDMVLRQNIEPAEAALTYTLNGE